MRFSRLEQLIGSEKLHRLSQARVAVFGLGAVGSYAVEALARAGIGHLRLVDFDTVQPSNINRQLYALESTTGISKIEVARLRVQDINPGCELDAREKFINAESVSELLEPPLDAVVDAIDAVSSKVHLLRESVQRGIYTISSMGAAGRMDAGAVNVGDISETSGCPLARIIRKRLRRCGVHNGIQCVYSTEPARNMHPMNPEIDPAYNPSLGRPRQPIGSISYVVGTFGLRIAGEVINTVLNTDKSTSELSDQKIFA